MQTRVSVILYIPVFLSVDGVITSHTAVFAWKPFRASLFEDYVARDYVFRGAFFGAESFACAGLGAVGAALLGVRGVSGGSGGEGAAGGGGEGAVEGAEGEGGEGGSEVVEGWDRGGKSPRYSWL